MLRPWSSGSASRRLDAAVVPAPARTAALSPGSLVQGLVWHHLGSERVRRGAMARQDEQERYNRWKALGIRTDIPHPARVYDYLLGGCFL
jgi:hypothetical protein